MMLTSNLKSGKSLSTCALVAIGVFFAADAHAQATRTWVSGVGDDANPCSRTAPCKTFAGAISKTAAAGEINTLDPGGFGALTITKSIRVDGTASGTAGVLVSGTNGIVISAGATDTVTLRNLTINGTGTAGAFRGIKFISGKSLVIENCEIFGFGQRAISIETTNDSTVYIHNTRIISNLSNGVYVSPQNGTTSKVTMDQVNISDNANFGLIVFPGGKVTMKDGTISNHGLPGVRVDGTGSTASADLDNVAISYNATGIQVVGGATVRLSNSTVTGNGVGLDGPVFSFGNNRLQGNTTANGPASNSLSLQ